MKLSVIIPTCNRPDLLIHCLEKLGPGQQKLDSIFYEVIVTDDGRDDSSRKLLQDKFNWAQWVKGPRRGPAANRNQGAKQAKGEWLVFLDDDCLPDRHWLEAIWTDASIEALDVIEGKTITPDKVDNPFRQGVENLTGDNYWSCNLAVRRAVFSTLGGFDEDFLEAGGEDMEFAYRIRQQQVSARFLEQAVVLHPTRRLTWRGLIWRTKLKRWMLLYYHKTGQALPLNATPIRVLLSLISTQIINTLRTTWHFFKRFDSRDWRTALFWQAWGLLTLPVMLPYLYLWEIRFRDMLQRRRSDSKIVQ